MMKIALAIHGGCGVMPEDSMTPEEWEGARHDLAAALRAGYTRLKAGHSAIDAVEAAVMVMENSPHFNAGHGAALNENGIHELDASIMDGATLEAGAISASRAIRNPIKAARALMEDGRAVYMTGPAADRFAEAKGLPVEPQSYFTTQKRVDALEAMKRHAAAGTEGTENEKHGTVGAVALDAAGHLAAATSTGGYTNKPDGRVGDSPVIGAGTYARDGVCAVSGTGKGEFFIRYVVGHEIASRMAYLRQDIATATDGLIHHDLAPHEIGAGLVAIDAQGVAVAPYNTPGMFRGWVTPEGMAFVATHEQVYEIEL
ncbi:MULTISPECIES: isoaspartyl peptidase/L-asparaginase [unclassified Rhizobium]|jgi:beta-aspartyl-peptidase (threonine type)|uniref:isoaspartyl peptidase/L-asparaginase family protein n=1 Tax=unclassified Rhizobium TaxID=2613769 RepID=UPI000648CDA1|nr:MULTISPECIES: isoaspartyl peptidase/L-asparaginase [unclassified Rhizobium]MBN8950688.1 isoaspartyl peptidase/L-asparaginase [Rhizobium tropici]OJY66225.1 MAG: beta-aspartyl-peptidase [Rhizobium sp. 60-20]RKD69210.1 asparaginase [Rhizobium sp. WW_1]